MWIIKITKRLVVPTSLKISPLYKYMFEIVKSIIDTIYDPFTQAVTIVILNQLILSKFITKLVVDETDFTN